jgi:hypothetical protein
LSRWETVSRQSLGCWSVCHCYQAE